MSNQHPEVDRRIGGGGDSKPVIVMLVAGVAATVIVLGIMWIAARPEKSPVPPPPSVRGFTHDIGK